MKKQTFRFFLGIILGIGVLLTSLALNSTIPVSQGATSLSATQTGTVGAGAGVRDEAGSTDGIMVVALVIVMIVIIPILLKRKAWGNGSRNKTAPPS